MSATESKGTTDGFDAWAPEPGTPSFFGLDRSRASEFFTRPYVPESWLVRLRRRLAEWVSP